MLTILTFCQSCECRTNNKDVWIGLYKETDSEWFDGDQSAYRNWAAGEPSTTGECVINTDEGFKNRNCDNQYRYICKKNAGF